MPDSTKFTAFHCPVEDCSGTWSPPGYNDIYTIVLACSKCSTTHLVNCYQCYGSVVYAEINLVDGNNHPVVICANPDCGYQHDFYKSGCCRGGQMAFEIGIASYWENIRSHYAAANITCCAHQQSYDGPISREEVVWMIVERPGVEVHRLFREALDEKVVVEKVNERVKAREEELDMREAELDRKEAELKDWLEELVEDSKKKRKWTAEDADDTPAKWIKNRWSK